MLEHLIPIIAALHLLIEALRGAGWIVLRWLPRGLPLLGLLSALVLASWEIVRSLAALVLG